MQYTIVQIKSKQRKGVAAIAAMESLWKGLFDGNLDMYIQTVPDPGFKAQGWRMPLWGRGCVYNQFNNC